MVGPQGEEEGGQLTMRLGSWAGPGGEPGGPEHPKTWWPDDLRSHDYSRSWGRARAISGCWECSRQRGLHVGDSAGLFSVEMCAVRFLLKG
jgi:hypothetical protein